MHPPKNDQNSTALNQCLNLLIQRIRENKLSEAQILCNTHANIFPNPTTTHTWQYHHPPCHLVKPKWRAQSRFLGTIKLLPHAKCVSSSQDCPRKAGLITTRSSLSSFSIPSASCVALSDIKHVWAVRIELFETAENNRNASKIVPPPPLYKLRPCPSYSRRRDCNNCVRNFNCVRNVVRPDETWVCRHICQLHGAMDTCNMPHARQFDFQEFEVARAQTSP